MFTARQVVQNAFITYPKLKDATPDEIAEAISDSIETQVKDTYNDSELRAKITIDYLKSNLKGYYYCVVCDICAAKCRKAYVKKIVVSNVPIAKVLCGKCAKIKYKRKTREEKRALRYALNPRLAECTLEGNNPREGLVALEAFYIRRQLEDKAEKLIEKLTGNLPAEIIE